MTIIRRGSAKAKLFLRAIKRKSITYLNMVVTKDETWIDFAMPESNKVSCQWVRKESKLPVKVKKRMSNKVMIIPFFDRK